jgi:hypothetical protein
MSVDESELRVARTSIRAKPPWLALVVIAMRGQHSDDN